MKIMILGYSGAGKSTLARRLGEKLSLPVLHLDTVYWAPGWTERGAEEQQSMVERFLDSHSGWIIEGTYRKLFFERRFAEADRVYLLLLNRWLCLSRVLRRWRRYRGRERPDRAAGCPEKIDAEFLLWVLWKGRGKKKEKWFLSLREKAPEKVTVLRRQKDLAALYENYRLSP
ncbi:MAG: Topology modulation protein [bacterium]